VNYLQWKVGTGKEENFLKKKFTPTLTPNCFPRNFILIKNKLKEMETHAELGSRAKLRRIFSEFFSSLIEEVAHAHCGKVEHDDCSMM
jgi:hypothetical protein